MSSLLCSLTDMNVHDYVESLTKRAKGEYEVDAVLLAISLNLELHIHYIEEGAFKKLTCNSSPAPKPIIRLYVEQNGSFSTVYSKETIRAAGIAQSIVLEVKAFVSCLDIGFGYWRGQESYADV